MKVTIAPTPASIEAIQKKLDGHWKGGRTADIVRQAANDTAKDTKDKIYAETKKMYTINTGGLKKSDIKLKRAAKGRADAEITVRGEPMGIRKAYKNRANGKRKAASAMVLQSGSMHALEMRARGRVYKAFIVKLKHAKKDGSESIHEGIFQRVPGKMMRRKKGKEAIREIMSMSRAKAAETAYRKKVAGGMQDEITSRMLKMMHDAIAGGGE